MSNIICKSNGDKGKVEDKGTENDNNMKHYLNEFKSRLLARVRELHVYGNIQMVEGG
jgi:hypothetical protein